MARKPKPWFWEARQIWCVNLRGERHYLGPDEKEAHRQFHELMARPEGAPPPKPKADDEPLVADILDSFLGFCQKNRAEATYIWYRDFIQMFISFTPEPATLTVADLKPFHIAEWCDSNAHWKANPRRAAITSITRAFNWAEKMGYVERNPIRNIERPQAEPREEFLTVQQWESIRDHYAEGDPFRVLLTYFWETGCRPFEARKLEAKHIDLERYVCVIPRSQAKGKKRPRVVYLNAAAVGILTPLIAANPKGPVFRNADGNPWTSAAINSRFKRLKKHFDDKKFCAVIFRHGFAHRKLASGHDHLTVGELMGHCDSSMIATVYGHISQATDHLKQAVNSD